jgi:hypothetical protein
MGYVKVATGEPLRISLRQIIRINPVSAETMSLDQSFSILREGASEELISRYIVAAEALPAGYIDLLRSSDGVDGALNQPEEVALRLYSISEAIDCNLAYEIQRWMPQLWMIGDDGGDYAYCFDRSSNQSKERWAIVEIPLGALFEDEIVKIATDFVDWARDSFKVRPGAAFSEKRIQH